MATASDVTLPVTIKVTMKDRFSNVIKPKLSGYAEEYLASLIDV